MEKQILDYVLVPSGLIVMAVYHVWLLRRIIRRPATTVVGINAVNRRLWVAAMMEDTSKNGVLAVQTLRNNIMASTVLASTAIMLSSVIAVLMSGGPGTGGGGGDRRPSVAVFGDHSKAAFSIKFFSIFVCFMVAFLLNVQSIRYYSHASILINVPHKMSHSRKKGSNSNILGDYNKVSAVTVEFVARMVNRGSYFWSMGLRAFYFSFPLFLWIFGPIPMFMCCVVLVSLLYFLDVTFVHSAAAAPHDDEEEEEGFDRPNEGAAGV